jgi:hypothetical protein
MLKDKLKLIGKAAKFNLPSGLTIDVEVLDFKSSYGKDRWLVKPVAGSGRAWVQGISTK